MRAPDPYADRYLADLQIMTRHLHEIATAMMTNDQLALISALQTQRVYAEKFQTDVWKEVRRKQRRARKEAR